MTNNSAYKKKNSTNSPTNIYAEYHSELIQSGNLDQLINSLLTIINNLGFTDFIFLRTDRHWLSNSRHGLLYSVPDEFIRIYHEEKMYNDDLLIAHATHSSHPMFSSTLYDYINNAPYEISFLDKNRRIQQLNRRFLFFNHYAVPMKSSNNKGSVLLIITSKNILSETFQHKINCNASHLYSLCKAIDIVCTNRFYDCFIEYKNSPITFSKRQLTVLSILANDDLTIEQVARRLKIKPITAHQHLSSIKKKLGVNTNIAAIKKLIQLNGISYW